MESFDLDWNHPWQAAERVRHTALMRQLKAELYQVRQEQAAQERAYYRAEEIAVAPTPTEPRLAERTAEVSSHRSPDRLRPRLRPVRQSVGG